MSMEMELQQEPPPDKWEYVRTPRSARIRATPQIEFIPYTYGDFDAEEIREIARRGVNAVNSHDALVQALEALEPYLTTEAQMLDSASLNEGRASKFDVASLKARHALAQVRAAKEQV